MSRRGRTGPARIVLLDKPEGPTSFDLVRAVRRSSGYRKVGHGGTLDPFASGLLVLGLGSATRLMRYLSEGEKTYTGTIRFGSSTDTDDKTGKVLETGVCGFSCADLESALREFEGTVEQLPPMVSALKVGGKRAYALYRDEGTRPALKPREVIIHQITLQDFDGEYARIQVRCGGGTYIRALARDLGKRLACPAHLHSLRREKVGSLDLSRAVSPELLTDDFVDDEERGVFPPLLAVEGWPRLRLDGAHLRLVRSGVQPPLQWWHESGGKAASADESRTPNPRETPDVPERWALLNPQGELVALAEIRADGPRLLMVLPEDSGEDL